MATWCHDQPLYAALINVPTNLPLVLAENLLTCEALITESVSLLLAMPVPPKFFIYPSTMSVNLWPNPMPHPPHIRTAHHFQALGGWPNLSHSHSPPAPLTMANCRHWRQRHFWRFWLLPPNLGLSQQKSQWPQSIRRRQAAQAPHLRFCRRFV